ncbi:12964_t:CDS:2, partial [Dentiscutata heterogama]
LRKNNYDNKRNNYIIKDNLVIKDKMVIKIRLPILVQYCPNIAPILRDLSCFTRIPAVYLL